MTKLIAFLLSLLFFLHHDAFATSKKNDIINSRYSELMVPNPDTTFNIENETAVAVGWVTVDFSDTSNSYIDVTGSGTFSTIISYAPTGCVINGQSLTINTPRWVNIDTHTWVYATWSTNVVVINDVEIY